MSNNQTLNTIKEELNKETQIYIKVKVQPRSNNNDIILIKDSANKVFYKIKIKSIPEKGRANKEVLKYLKSLLKPLKVDLNIISGHTSQIKLIKIIKT